MSKIAEIVSKAKSFANTNAGQVAVTGLSYMATMAICGGLTAKFLPGKATFGRALGLGIYAVGMQTLVGTATASEQQQRLEWLEDSAETDRREMNREIMRLRGEMFRLHERLSEKDNELESAKTCLRHAQADMDGTVKYIGELQGKLSTQDKELEHSRLALKGWKADMDGTMKQVYRLREENAKLHSDLEEVRGERDTLLAAEKELVKQRDGLKARKNGVVYPRPRKGEIPLGCPAVEDLLGRLLNNA